MATLSVLVLPVLFIYGLEAAGLLHSAILSVVVAIAASMGVATAGTAYWTRRGGSKEIVFGDLMVWSWLRRMRAERKLRKVWNTLGLDQVDAAAGGLSPARQAEVLEQLASTLESRDLYTHGHSRRVTKHAHMIARAMGLPARHAEKVRAAAAMHDVGKLNIPRAVLNKPGKLSDEEFELIKRHPTDGAEMVAGLGDPEITAMIRHHHERVDGRGYPEGLTGEDIPLGARIISVADTFDAITSSRPYRPARRHKQAIGVLKEESGRQLDAQAVDAFLSYYSGRRSIAWWAFVTTAFQRLLAALAGPIESASASSITQGAVAVAASAALGTSLVAPVAQPDRRSHRDDRAGAKQALEATTYRQATFAEGGPGVARSDVNTGNRKGRRHGTGGAHGRPGRAKSPKAGGAAGKRAGATGAGGNPKPPKDPHVREPRPADEPGNGSDGRTRDPRTKDEPEATTTPVVEEPSGTASEPSDSGPGSTDSGGSGSDGSGSGDSGSGSADSGESGSGTSGSSENSGSSNPSKGRS